jgi:glycosyltransferase involved in cell wall biosynthesis
MKILIVNRHRDDVVGGSEIQCDLIATHLTARGHALTYAVMRPARATYARPYACVPIGAPAALHLGRLLRRLRPDVVYWRFNKAHLLSTALQARLAGAVFLLALSHDDDTRFWPAAPARSSGPRRGAWRRGAQRTWLRLAGALEATGQWLAHGFVAQHGDQARRLPPGRTRTIRSSVLTESVPFAWPRPYVAWVANLKARKRPERFVELAARLADEPVDFLAVGALQDARYAYMGEPGRVPPNFRYLGARTPAEANGFIAASELLVLTCDPEGFPNVLMQAWNAGRATLSQGYDPEGLIAANELGAVADSTPALAAATRRLLCDGPARAAIGERARAFAARNFALAANAEALEAFCAELVARHGRRTARE